MAAALSILVLVLSLLFLGVMIVALVLLRRGEGPKYSATRAYDANRREAVRLLTGEEDEAPGQWYDPAREETSPDDPLASPYREAVADALRAVVPEERDLELEGPGRARLAAEDVRVVAELSTADLREHLDEPDEGPALVIGLVLFNPEPPGGDAARVALPVQALFPALRRAGRDDLVNRFEELAKRKERR